MSSHLGIPGFGFRAIGRLPLQGLHDIFRSIRINAGVILPDLKARKLLPPVVPSPYDDDDDDRMCVCVRTTWSNDRRGRSAELHAPSIRQQTAWSGIFLEELIRDHLAQKFSAFYGTETFNTILTKARLLLLFWATSSPYHHTLLL